jgi:hypothetical protein
MTDPRPALPNKAVDRRTFLRRTLRAGGAFAVLSAMGLVAVVRTTGYVVDEKRAAKLRALAPWQLVVVDALADRLCAADVPYDAPGSPPTPREAMVSEFFDAFVAGSDSAIRRDCLACVGVIEHGWPLACGYRRRFSALDAASQDDVLARMESSSMELLRGAFRSIKALVMMGYYRDPRTWGVLGYDGPNVRRPDAGWTPARHLPVVQSKSEGAP